MPVQLQFDLLRVDTDALAHWNSKQPRVLALPRNSPSHIVRFIIRRRGTSATSATRLRDVHASPSCGPEINHHTTLRRNRFLFNANLCAFKSIKILFLDLNRVGVARKAAGRLARTLMHDMCKFPRAMITIVSCSAH